jgi:hypothetical protein
MHRSSSHRRAFIALVAAIATLHLGVPAADAQEDKRREELAKVIDKINDPDPLMRIAALEEILARGNATEVQLAIKAAMNSNDPDLKSVALRGYLASQRDLYLDARLPKEVEAALEQADAKDREAIVTRRAVAEWRQGTGDRVHVRLEKMDLKTGRFVAYGMNRLDKTDERTRGDGHIVGTRVRMSVGIWGVRRCVIELVPTQTLTLDGSATCDNMPRMLLSTQMY